MSKFGDAKSVLHRLNAAGYEAYFVGGCVRDMHMGLEPHDYDVCTSARPEEMLSLFSDFSLITAGRKHGTVGVITETGPVEVTTFRRESVYSDHRHPDAVAFVSELKEDLARRDFTINAMAMGEDGQIFDYFHGEEDIRRRSIRCVGQAKTRFEEDALRILRALRFASRFGFTIESETAAGIHICAPDLERIAGERKWSELKEILGGPYAVPVIRTYLDVIRVLLPEARDLAGNISGDWLVRLATILPPDSDLSELKRLRCEKKVLAVVNFLQNTPCPTSDADIWYLSLRYGEGMIIRLLQYHGMDTSRLSALLQKSPCPCRSDLAIRGDELQKIGLEGAQIARMLDELICGVFRMEIPNEKACLLERAKELAVMAYGDEIQRNEDEVHEFISE